MQAYMFVYRRGDMPTNMAAARSRLGRVRRRDEESGGKNRVRLGERYEAWVGHNDKQHEAGQAGFTRERLLATTYHKRSVMLCVCVWLG